MSCHISAAVNGLLLLPIRMGGNETAVGRADLRQLPEGQWYATKEYLRTYGNSARKTRGSEITWNLDFRILQESEFPPDTFNGEKLLEDSKRDGTVIETY